MELIQKLNYKDLPGFSRLFREYQYEFDNLREFYPAGNPRDFGSYQKHAQSILASGHPRAEVVSVLNEQNRNWGAHENALDNLQTLNEPDCLAIVTGQQVGIFGGPLFTLYKALTTIQLSNTLNREYGLKTIPIFWLATDDHDLKEIMSATCIDREGNLKGIALDLKSYPEGIPAGQAILNEDIGQAIQDVLEGIPETEFKTALRERLCEAYHPGRTASDAFALWMIPYLSSLGLVFMDGADPRLKRLGKKVFIREIQEKSPSTRAVMEASSRLVKNGYHTQLTQREDGCNLFLHSPGRKAMKQEGEHWIISGENTLRDTDSLIEQIRKAPEFVSPNVVLRPVYQDTLLPTLAYVSGPSELAYYAQLGGVYENFNRVMPFIFPRAGLTLLENRIARNMQKLGIQMTDSLGNIETVITDLLKQSLPSELEQDFNLLSTGINQFNSLMKKNIQEWDPTLVNAVETTCNSMKHNLEQLNKKIIAAHKKKNDIVRQQIYRTFIHIHPAGMYQERVFNMIPYLCKYGPGLVKDLLNIIDVSDPEHRVVIVGQREGERS